VKKRLFWSLTVILSIVFIYSGSQVYRALDVYGSEENTHSALLGMKPAMGETPADGADKSGMGVANDADKPGMGVANGGADNGWIAGIKAINPDTVGWITIPGTKVDYPIVMSRDNEEYLHTDIYGNKSPSGSIFVDCACDGDFGGFNTIIYGHHMNNGSMFGTIKYFRDKTFFDANRTGTVTLPDRAFTLYIFAFLSVEPGDPVIYDTISADGEGVSEYIAYVKARAERFRDVDLSASDHIVTLSTCTNGPGDKRMALLAKLCAFD